MPAPTESFWLLLCFMGAFACIYWWWQGRTSFLCGSNVLHIFTTTLKFASDKVTYTVYNPVFPVVINYNVQQMCFCCSNAMMFRRFPLWVTLEFVLRAMIGVTRRKNFSLLYIFHLSCPKVAKLLNEEHYDKFVTVCIMDLDILFYAIHICKRFFSRQSLTLV